eukprot:scpid33816/ scgid1235/ Coiled-coil domain-containing protein 81
MDNVAEFVSDTKSQLTSRLTNNDIISIWEYVSQFVEQQLLAEKGVSIKNLGTFTFSRKSLHIGNGMLSVQRPIFNLSPQLMQSYGLSATKHFTSGDVPVVPLNLSSVASDSPYSRTTIQEVVELIVREIPRALHKGKKVDLLMNGVGRLRICNRDAKFRFFREFLNTLDSSGKTEQVFRLDTRGSVADPSVMSRNHASTVPSRSTSSTVVLPRLVSGVGGGSSLTSARRSRDVHGIIPEDVSEQSEDDTSQEDQDDDDDGADGRHSPSARLPAADDRKSSGPSSPGSDGSAVSLLPDIREQSQAASSCSHRTGTGQDLCYLCHQRASRNVQRDFKHEIRKQQEVDDQQIAVHMRRQDDWYLAREKARIIQARNHAIETHKHNIQVAKHKQDVKGTRPSGYEASFLMRNRPLSPSRTLQQCRYGDELKEQMDINAKTWAEKERQRTLDERLERIHLADQLASSYKDYVDKRQKDTSKYRQSLRDQIETNARIRTEPEQVGTQMVGSTDDDPSASATAIKRQQDREAAQANMQEQYMMSQLKAQRQRKAQKIEKEHERRMLIKARKELRSELDQECLAKSQAQTELIKSWMLNRQEKAQRDREEELSRKHQSTHLLEQCKEYGRCKQCQRDKAVAAGTSHVLKDGRYMAGFTMLM